MKRLVLILAIALVGSICQPTAGNAAFGINHFDVTFTGEDASTAAQAGSHPFAMTTSLGANFSGEETEGRLKELFVDLPPGLLVDTNAAPRCLAEEFLDPEGGCSLATVIGTSSSSFLAPGHSETALVYNLVPPEGVLLRLGFRVAGAANVFVDVGLSSDPPYNPIATAGDWPETVDVFATGVQLWGVPAASAHDAERGGPGGDLVRPFLTLPTSCEGPQATYYEALSWEGDEDFGNALTHGDAGEPLGFVGCSRLGFESSLAVRPTTEEAQSPTGLDASVDLADAGLVNPGGISQSQIRNLVVALPGGTTTGPSLSSATGSCSEADLEAETPEAVSGEGCPETSDIGTVEAESPLVSEPIGGAVYRATPDENFAGDAAVALYLVLKNSRLGVVITQPVGLEEDTETGRLIAIAEEMPQLPFSHLRLHLDDGGSSTLVSPTFCGKYTTEANFTAWSGEGPFRVTSSFPIVSGPSGGPCPTSAHEKAQLGETASPPPAGSAAPLSSGPGEPHRRPSTRHRCRKGRHRVLRHGQVRCSRKPQGKHDRHHRRSR